MAKDLKERLKILQDYLDGKANADLVKSEMVHRETARFTIGDSYFEHTAFHFGDKISESLPEICEWEITIGQEWKGDAEGQRLTEEEAVLIAEVIERNNTHSFDVPVVKVCIERGREFHESFPSTGDDISEEDLKKMAMEYAAKGDASAHLFIAESLFSRDLFSFEESKDSFIWLDEHSDSEPTIENQRDNISYCLGIIYCSDVIEFGDDWDGMSEDIEKGLAYFQDISSHGLCYGAALVHTATILYKHAKAEKKFPEYSVEILKNIFTGLEYGTYNKERCYPPAAYLILKWAQEGDLFTLDKDAQKHIYEMGLETLEYHMAEGTHIGSMSYDYTYACMSDLRDKFKAMTI